ncbi:phosphonate ABC transporter, permease protein PhnE [Undibacterium sp. SXout7W]|uniref:phosphonate ABC transporter, permease protein PhnE n=1 Tax=Undibacterium sp. SXout7W TaxID=3413049 RepID=UPI003BEF725B
MAPIQTHLPAAPGIQWSTRLLLLGLVLLIAASFLSLSLHWSDFFKLEAIQTTKEFLSGFSPPETDAGLLKKTALATLETLSMSAIGTLIAALVGILIALPASGRLGKAAHFCTRGILNILRSIPELVWASILLITAGLGPFAGTLALAVHTTGVLGRLFADAFENCPPLPEASLRINGTHPIAAFLYATLPQNIPQMLSYSLYRWENNIRAAAILGVVGAGGLGQMLKYHLSLFQMHQAATVILAMLGMVAIVDAISFALRKKMMS